MLFTFIEFRGHVESRSEFISQRLIVFVIKCAKPEICQLDSNFVWFIEVWFLEEHILGLDVSVGNLHGLVQILQYSKHLLDYVLSSNLRNGLVLAIRLQAAIFDVFHDNVKFFFIFNHLMRFHDILMISFSDRHNLVL